jgi:alpha-1,2-mannosyltransferase
MVGEVRPEARAQGKGQGGRRLLLAGLAAFAVALGLYVIYTVIHPKSFTMDPVDLAVYRSGGLIVRHVRPLYDPQLKAPLYDWVGYGRLHLPFTYTPFAAIAFALISFIPWWLSQQLSVAVDILALLAALWFTLGGLGYRHDKATRLGATLLGAAAVFWTEPVLRTMYLGQVNLVLMALIIWDLCQPDTPRSRHYKGFATGVAAGIKLVPLIFIPYLLLARKFRQAAMACAGFAFTIVLGFVILPADSSKWWFHGLFVQGGRTGFTGWAGNQSLDGLITRLTGSVNSAKPEWIAAAIVVGAAGVIAAALLDRKGYPVPALLMAALTGLLVSPISWDHHWVWIAPAALTAVHYAVRARQHQKHNKRAAAIAITAIAAVAWFGAWPARLFTARLNLGNDSLGLLWIPRNTNPVYYQWYGDRPWFTEYHWHGLALIAGNAYVLAGLALFTVLAAMSVLPSAAKEHHDEPGRSPGSQRGRLRLPAA